MNRTLLQTVCKAVPIECWPVRDEVFVVGVSGGPDSVALAHLLDELNRAEGRGWRIHLAHLNHMLRGKQADEDAAFVAALSKSKSWAVTIEERPIEELARESDMTLEEVARNERYAFFERVLQATGGTVAATAHHADDNAETILHRILRGTGLRGLAGIPVTRALRDAAPFRLIRPMLGIRRSEIMTYLRENNIEYRSDPTNETIDFTRNRIRNELIPDLEDKYNPSLREALLRLAEQARWTNEHLQELVEEAYREVRIGGEPATPPAEVVLDARALVDQPQLLQTELVRRAIVSLGIGQKRIGFDHLTSVIELAGRNVSGKRLELPGGLIVSKHREKLTFARKGAGEMR